MSPFEIVSVALGLSTMAFGVIAWFLNRLIYQHKELNKAKAETMDSKFEGLIQRLDDLVKQISHLFRDQEMVTDSINNLSGRVGKVEKRIGEHFVRCNERERLVLDIKNKQDAGLEKLTTMEASAVVGGRRTCDPPIDRSDRES